MSVSFGKVTFLLFPRCYEAVRKALDYNQLKIRILKLFEASSDLQSDEVLKLLSQEQGLHLTDKAVEMALLRYWRQGLLNRTRHAGRFHYKLTEKGAARKNWLMKTK